MQRKAASLTHCHLRSPSPRYAYVRPHQLVAMRPRCSLQARSPLLLSSLGGVDVRVSSAPLLVGRRLASSVTGSQDVPAHHANDEDGELLSLVELLAANEAEVATHLFTEGAPAGATATQTMEPVAAVNTFSRAKISNFMQRMQTSSGGSSAGGGSGAPTTAASSPPKSGLAFTVHRVEGAGEGNTYHAKLRLPLPVAYGERYAEGYAGSEKEAEGVAAMHAERVLDALGFPLYRLPSKQKQHAEAARREGRWAPLPDEAPLPVDTPTPPPLYLAAEGATSARQREEDASNYLMVDRGVFSPLLATLASPYFIDYKSIRRIRQFFTAYKVRFEQYCNVRPLQRLEPGSGRFNLSRVQKEKGRAGKETVYVAQIMLPLPDTFGRRIARGKAPSRQEALALACMHAELIIDVLGLSLFPGDPELQALHARECRLVRRWCAEPGSMEYFPDKPSPPPLCLSVQGTNGSTKGQGNVARTRDGARHTATAELLSNSTSPSDSELSIESMLLQHSNVVRQMHAVTDVAHVDAVAKDLLAIYCHLATGTDLTEVPQRFPLLVEGLGCATLETYRATVTVPIPAPPTTPSPLSPPSRRSLSAKTSSSRSTAAAATSFVAVGIAPTAEEAEQVVAMHALEMLRVLHRIPATLQDVPFRLLPSEAWRSLADVPDLQVPPPYRLVPPEGLLRRVVTHGVRATARRREAAQLQDTEGRELSRQAQAAQQQQTVVRDILRARDGMDKWDWSLEADADGCIIVGPTGGDNTSRRSYVHTLPGVRTTDSMVLTRFKDYMERHGKRMESSVVVRTEPVEEGEAGEESSHIKYIATAILPVPMYYPREVHAPGAGATRHIARGEGFTEPDAIAMCATHAELLLDSLGFPLYDHAVLQEQHADTCKSLGRWAPCGDREMPPAALAQVPPPVRKERRGSAVWSVVESKWAREQQNRPAATETGSAGGAGGIDAETSSSTPSMDDELCNLAKLTSVHPSGFFREAAKHVDAYFKHRGQDFARCVRQYKVMDTVHGPIHRALVQVPVPAAFGQRYAVGCASSKRTAHLLCAMHATRILDALRIPIYTGKRQLEYARLAQRKGVVSPLPGEGVLLAAVASPPGLSCVMDMQEMPDVPVAPTMAEVVRVNYLWTDYTRACRAYIARAADMRVHEAVMQRRCAPRRGVPLEDEGLDAVERLPTSHRSHGEVVRLCAQYHLPPPPFFSVSTFGHGARKVYYAESAVLGTPFVARACAKSHQDCVHRVHMHYEYLLVHGVAANSAHTRTMPPRLQPNDGATIFLYDLSVGQFTADGRHAALATYAITHAPHRPVRLLYKEGRNARGGSVDICVAEMEDGASGTFLTGKSEGTAPKEVLTQMALNDLFSLLQSKADFQAILQFVKQQRRISHPLHSVALPARLWKQLSEKRSWEPATERTAKVHDTWELLRHMPLVAPFPEKGLHAEDPLHALLLLLASARLGQTAQPLPLTLPLAARTLLPSMGLLYHQEAAGVADRCAGDEAKPLITELGVLVVLLAQCLPSLPALDPPNYVGKSTTTCVLRRQQGLSLQLGKLLYAGLQEGVVDAVCRVAAVVINAAVLCEVGKEGEAVDDLVSYVLLRYDDRVARGDEVAKRLLETESHVANKLKVLKDVVEQAAAAAAATVRDQGSDLPSLFSCAWKQEQTKRDDPAHDSLAFQMRWSKLQRCIAFSTYPHCSAVRASSLNARAGTPWTSVEVLHGHGVRPVRVASCPGREGNAAAAFFARFLVEVETSNGQGMEPWPVGALLPPLSLVGCVSYASLDTHDAAATPTRVVRCVEDVPYMLRLHDGSALLILSPHVRTVQQTAGEGSSSSAREVTSEPMWAARAMQKLHEVMAFHHVHGLLLPSDARDLVDALVGTADYACHVSGAGGSHLATK